MSRTGSIHYARLESSPRLQRALAALQAAGARGLTTREWIQAADICAVNSCASELKKNGYAVTCQMEGRSVAGASIFRYRLVEG